jgi:hypothetical protein
MKLSVSLLLGLILELCEEITKNTNIILTELLFEQFFDSFQSDGLLRRRVHLFWLSFSNLIPFAVVLRASANFLFTYYC